MNKKVVIIGAGVSGLIAAQNLENAGFQPVVYDKNDRVGGRVQTDYIDGSNFDKGFQILLPNYPAVQKYLNIDLLNLKYMSAGAIVFKKNYSGKIGNPAKDFDLLFPTLFSSLASFSDKLKIFKLKRRIQKKSFNDIFSSENISTLNYLKDFGFSEKLIGNFFMPFIGGVFLDSKLETSSRMFEFTFKLFLDTKAAIPEKGMQAIPNQLANKLRNTTFHFNTSVTGVENNYISLANGETISYDFAIITTDPSNLISNLKNQKQNWKGVDNIYFEVKNRVITSPMLGLLAEEGTIVNNFHYTKLASASQQILSVSVIQKHNLDNDTLIKKVTQELKEYCEIEVIKCLKHYKISQALPEVSDVNYSIPHTETKIKDNIYLAGDVLSNGSLNAAMLNGEAVAQAIIEEVKGIKVSVS